MYVYPKRGGVASRADLQKEKERSDMRAVARQQAARMHRLEVAGEDCNDEEDDEEEEEAMTEQTEMTAASALLQESQQRRMEEYRRQKSTGGDGDDDNNGAGDLVNERDVNDLLLFNDKKSTCIFSRIVYLNDILDYVVSDLAEVCRLIQVSWTWFECLAHYSQPTWDRLAAQTIPRVLPSQRLEMVRKSGNTSAVWSPLGLACVHGITWAARRLVRSPQARLAPTDHHFYFFSVSVESYSMSALTTACRYGRVAVVAELLAVLSDESSSNNNNNSNNNMVDDNKNNDKNNNSTASDKEDSEESATAAALQENSEETAAAAAATGTDTDFPVVSFCSHGHCEKQMYHSDSSSVNSRSIAPAGFNGSPLHWAVHRGFANIVKLFLWAPDKSSNFHSVQHSALFLAVRLQQDAVASLLVSPPAPPSGDAIGQYRDRYRHCYVDQQGAAATSTYADYKQGLLLSAAARAALDADMPLRREPVRRIFFPNNVPCKTINEHTHGQSAFYSLMEHCLVQDMPVTAATLLRTDTVNEPRFHAIELACKQGHATVLSELLDRLPESRVRGMLAGPARCPPCSHDASPSLIHAATASCNHEVVSMLLLRGAPALLFDDFGNLPLHVACSPLASNMLKVESLKLLVETAKKQQQGNVSSDAGTAAETFDGGVNAKNKKQRTPLFVLFDRKYCEVPSESDGRLANYLAKVEYLLKCGAETEGPDTSALGLALTTQNKVCSPAVKLLLQHNALVEPGWKYQGCDVDLLEWAEYTTSDKELIEMVKACRDRQREAKKNAVASINA